MPLPAAERRRINRQNAQNSTGPRSDAGKIRSRGNALKHGLRAEVVALPGEDPASVQARSDAWNEYYQPRDPAEQHLVNQAVAATLLSDRVDRFHAAQLAKQVRDGVSEWDRQQGAEAVKIASGLSSNDPAAAVRDLRLSSHGCLLLIDRWTALADRLQEQGRWTMAERYEAVRLTGGHPGRLADSREAFLIVAHHLMIADRDSDELKRLLEPAKRPEGLRDYFKGDFPDPRVCLGALRLAVAGRVLELEAQAARASADEEADRAEAADRALILADGATARLFLRYHAEARTAFHRAYSALVKERRTEKNFEADGPESLVSPNEPNEPEPTPERPEPEEVEEAEIVPTAAPDDWDDDQKACFAMAMAAEARHHAVWKQIEAIGGSEVDEKWLAGAV